MTPTLRELVAEWERACKTYDDAPMDDERLSYLRLLCFTTGKNLIAYVLYRGGQVVRPEHIAAVLRALDAEGER